MDNDVSSDDERAVVNEAPDGSSPQAASIPDAWVPAAITAPYGWGENEMLGTAEIVGWRRGKWFLDYRVDEAADGSIFGAWAITHVPTGWLCCVAVGGLGFAKELTLEIDAWGEWGPELTPTDIRNRYSPHARELKKRHTKKVRFGDVPLWSQITHHAQGIEARQGGDGTAPSSDESPTPQGDAPQSTQEEPTHD